MKHTWKQLLSFVLAVMMVIGVLPAAFAAEDAPTTDQDVNVVTDENQAILQEDILDEIDSYFELAAKRDSERTIEDYIEATDDIAELVLASDTYVEGSMLEQGNGFFWQTTTGITCGYFPYQRYEEDGYAAPTEKRNATASALTAFNASSATSKDVCLVCPMYSEDTYFTEQYGKEAKEIATARGGKGWKLLNGNATVTNIAKAFETCGVVIFDSHGNTDWGYFDGGSNGKGTADCVSKANTSYLCLSSGSGLTSTDMAYVQGTYGRYPHAYGTTSGGYVIDGTAIANHMTKGAPNSILWMAICLGQATNGINAPLLSKGVNTVYGYSQSVTFVGDYAYEGEFWDNMIAGKTVADSVAAMKTKYGNWDYSTTMLTALGYSAVEIREDGIPTIAEARKQYAAFPIVSSVEDSYPGQGKTDDLQTVTTTMTLNDFGSEGTPIEPVAVTVNFSVPAGVSPISSVSCYQRQSIVLPSASGKPTNDTHNAAFLGWVAAPVSDSSLRPTFYTAGSSYTVTGDTTLYALYSYSGSSEKPSLQAMAAGDTLSSGDRIVIAAADTDLYLRLAKPDSTDTYLDYYELSDSEMPDDCIVNVTAVDGGWKLGDSTLGYMYNASSNYLTVSPSNTSTWKLIDNRDGTFYLSTTAANPRYLTCRTDLNNANANRWRVASNTGVGSSALTVYRLTAGGTIYTTEFTAAPCQHTQTHLANAVAATCTQPGYTGDTVCDSCGATLAEGSAIPAQGHDYRMTGAKSATCTEEGYTGDQVCSRCADTVKGQSLAALGHDYKTLNAKNATCTEEGYTGDQVCSRCADTVKGQSLAALGHQWESWVTILEPTCTSDGTAARHCSRCNETETSVISKISCPSASFTDLPEGAWYHSAVDYVVSHNLMNGTDTSSFSPDVTMTRAMLVTVLWRSEGSPEAGEADFADVSAAAYYAKAVAWAAENSVVNGIGDNRFDPEGQITREQLATILYRYAHGTASDGSALQSFADADAVSPYASSAMVWAVSAGLVRGTESGGRLYLDPQSHATRAQVAAILMRFMENQ